MSYGLVIGLLVISAFVAFTIAMAVFAVRWMANGAGAGSSIDAFLRGGHANPNPPDMPAT